MGTQLENKLWLLVHESGNQELITTYDEYIKELNDKVSILSENISGLSKEIKKKTKT